MIRTLCLATAVTLMPPPAAGENLTPEKLEQVNRLQAAVNCVLQVPEKTVMSLDGLQGKEHVQVDDRTLMIRTADGKDHILFLTPDYEVQETRYPVYFGPNQDLNLRKNPQLASVVGRVSSLCNKKPAV